MMKKLAQFTIPRTLASANGAVMSKTKNTPVSARNIAPHDVGGGRGEIQLALFQSYVDSVHSSSSVVSLRKISSRDMVTASRRWKFPAAFYHLLGERGAYLHAGLGFDAGTGE